MNPLEQYMVKLRQQNDELKTAWDNCVIRMTGADTKEQQQGLIDLLNALANLEGTLTSDTTPHWLKVMQSNASALTSDKNFGDGHRRISIFRQLSKAAVQMQSHVFDDSVTDGIHPLVNFDEVVGKHHNQETINQIYDKAIHAIGEALESDQIDSVRIQQDLRRILATIEEAKQSSFVNQVFQVPNLQIYLKAVAKVSAKKVPVLNFVLDVIEEANKHLEQSSRKAGKEIENLLAQQSQEIERVIEYQPLVIEHQQDDSAAAKKDSED